MSRTLNFDNFMSEKNQEPVLVTVYGKEYQVKPEIPASVSISEAVDLVKQYSTSKSSGFVNGVLASINKEVRKDG